MVAFHGLGRIVTIVGVSLEIFDFDFDKIEDKLNTLLPLLKQAKEKTMDYYKSSPGFKVQYGTDLAVDYLDDIIKLFRDKK